MVQKESVVKASKDQVSCDLLGEAAILDLKSGQYFGLNPIGSRIWELIQEPKSVAEILSSLLSEYDVEAARCESDLLGLLDEMERKGLVEIAGETIA